MSNSLTQLVPVFNGTNYMVWAPAMKNYLLSQGQWCGAIMKPLPSMIFPQKEVITKGPEGGDDIITLVDDITQTPLNFDDIETWIDNNDKARGNIMLRLHNVIAEKFYHEEHSSSIWEALEKEYGKPGIAAIYQEFTGVMTTTIPDNSDPSFALEKIVSHFTWMSTTKYILPKHLKAMILISKMLPSMTALIQLVCQMDDVAQLNCDKIKKMIIHSWEQKLSNCSARPQQPQAAKKISAIQRSGPPPSFQQQQQQPQQEEGGQNNQNSQRGGWRGGRGGRGGTFRGTCAGKNKQNQQQQAARPIEERAPSPAPSFVFGEIASPLLVPDVPRLVYPNFTNALSLAHRIGIKPTIETVKRLETGERAREEQRMLSRPNKRPRVKRDDEVSLYWSSDDDDEMFLDNSAGPSSWCTKLASPLDATNLFPTGYNTTHATIITASVIPNVENILCCPNVISDFAAKDHMNRVDWILDSGTSLHFTGDMNDFVDYTPLEKNITTNTATSTNTQIIGKERS